PPETSFSDLTYSSNQKFEAMKTKILNFSLVAALGLMTQSCTKDFLDVPSKEIVEAEDSNVVYEPESFVNAIYVMFTHWNYAFSFLVITDITSENADKCSSSTDTGTDKAILDNLNYSSTAGSFAGMWEQKYKSIGRATQAIAYTANFGLTDEAYKTRR